MNVIHSLHALLRKNTDAVFKSNSSSPPKPDDVTNPNCSSVARWRARIRRPRRLHRLESGVPSIDDDGAVFWSGSLAHISVRWPNFLAQSAALRDLFFLNVFGTSQAKAKNRIRAQPALAARRRRRRVLLCLRCTLCSRLPFEGLLAATQSRPQDYLSMVYTPCSFQPQSQS